MDFLREVSTFLEPEDMKLLRILMRDDVIATPITKIFEEPENAGKYFVLLKDRPKSLYLVAKIAERIEGYLDGDEARLSFELFMKSLEQIKCIQDKDLELKVYFLVRETIQKRIDNCEYENSAVLITELYDLGLKDLLKKLLLVVSDLSDSGEYSRAIKILNLLTPSESVNSLKSYILEEWGKSLISQGEYASAASRFMEGIRISNREELYLNLGDAYYKAEEFERAYDTYSSIEGSYKNEIELLRRKSMLLNSWGEHLVNKGDYENAIDKFNEAYQTAVRISDDEIGEYALKSARKALELSKQAT
ncbi:MAG: tetratricopeptide repeat protein [Archaeoglobaceae archaeon]